MDRILRERPEKLVPAIPPAEYKGSIAEWMTELQVKNLWNGRGWYGDIMIPIDTWWEILEKCEDGINE